MSAMSRAYTRAVPKSKGIGKNIVYKGGRLHSNPGRDLNQWAK